MHIGITTGSILSTLTFAVSMFAMKQPMHQYRLASTFKYSNPVLTVAALSNSQIVSGSWDNTVKQEDIIAGRCVNVFKGHAGFTRVVAACDPLVISGSDDKTIRLWDPRIGSVGVLRGHRGSISSLVPMGNHLVSGSFDGTVKTWDINMRKSLKTLEVLNRQKVESVVIDGDNLVVGCTYEKIPLFDSNTDECTKTLLGHAQWAAVRSVSVDPVTHDIISGSDDKTIKLWDSARGTCLKTIDGHNGAVLTVVVSPEEYISGSRDETVKVWDKNGCNEQTLQGHKGIVSSVIKHGDCIISGSFDKTIKVWR